MQEAVLGCPDTPEFLAQSANPYYRIPLGQSSPYGDQIMVQLRSLVSCKGTCSFESHQISIFINLSQGLNIDNFSEQFVKSFGAGTPYDNPLTRKYSKKMKDKSFYPLNGPWQNFAVRRFCELYSEGKHVVDVDDNCVDPDCVTRMIPLVALYAHEGERMMNKVEESTVLMQPKEEMVAITAVSAKLLQEYILGNGDEKSEEEVIKGLIKKLRNDPELDPLQKAVASLLQQVLDRKHLTSYEAIAVFGKD